MESPPQISNYDYLNLKLLVYCFKLEIVNIMEVFCKVSDLNVKVSGFWKILTFTHISVCEPAFECSILVPKLKT